MRAVWLVLALMTVACGSARQPTAPSAGNGTLLNPATGTYLLTLTMAQVGQQCGPSGCFSSGLCVSVSGATLPPPVTAPVLLDRNGDDLTMRAVSGSGSLVMQLRISGSDVSGTASGTLTDGKTTLSLGSPSETSLQAIGNLSASSIHGTLEGQLGSAAYSCSNNGHTWSLGPAR